MINCEWPHIAGCILTSFEQLLVKCVTLLRHNVHTLASLQRLDFSHVPQRSTSTGRQDPEAKILGIRLFRVGHDYKTLDQAISQVLPLVRATHCGESSEPPS